MKKNRMLLAACIMLLTACFTAAAESSDSKDAGGADKAAEKKTASGTADKTAEKKVNRASTIKCESGKIKLILKGGLGSYQLYAVNKDGAAAPVFVDYDEFMSTYFILRAGRTEYKLNESNGVESAAEKTDTGGRLLYKISRAADVSVEFMFMKSDPDKDDDMLRVKITVTSRESRTDSFALKGVFDTVLGERTGIHFSTSQTKSVNAEVQYRTMKNERWIISQGPEYGVQLLLDGGDITPPSVVTLGNKDIISLPLWEPVATTTRSFDNVMSYNNSAVLVNWEKVEIKPLQSSSVIFYIAVSADGETPAGSAYLASLAGSNAQPPVSGLGSPLPPQTAPAGKPKPEVPFDVITEEKLDPEYIRALISRINALEDDDKSVNRDELLHLNAELDAILDKLRQQ
jgi:hypothetical protein